MQTKPVNMKLPEVTKQQIGDIKADTVFTNNTAVVVAAVDLLYRHTVLGESIGQPVVLVIGSEGVTNLPIPAETMDAINAMISSPVI